MSNEIKPDGWCAYRNGKLVAGEYSGVIALYRKEWERECFADRGYEVKPVCLIDPQELSRLRRIEEWAKEAYQCFDNHKQATEAGDYEATRLFMKYDAIAAPKEEG